MSTPQLEEEFEMEQDGGYVAESPDMDQPLLMSAIPEAATAEQNDEEEDGEAEQPAEY